MRRASSFYRYGGLILLEYLLWGLGNPVTKIGLSSIPPFYCLAIRFGLAFALFVLFFRQRAFAGLTRENLGDCLLVCLPTAVAFILSTLALYLTTATTASFLMGISVLFTPFFSLLILKAKLNWRIFPIIALAVVGTYFLCGNTGRFVFGWGEGIALLCAITYAASLSYSEKHVKEIGIIPLSTTQAGVTALLALFCALLLEDASALSQTTAVSWGAVLYLALGCTFLAYLIQNLALQHLTAVFVSLAYCTEPLFTVIFSRLLLGEQLTLRGLLGGGLILAGLVLGSLLQTPSTQTTQQQQHKAG